MNKSGLTKKGSKLKKWVGWQNPAWHWCKFNFNGACKSSGISTASGLLRDYNGKWVGGFAMNINFCSITDVELWGLYQGLVMSWIYGVRWLLV